MLDNTSFDPKYDPDGINAVEDAESVSDEPQLNISQLENESVSDLADKLVSEIDLGYDNAEADDLERSLDLSSLTPKDDEVASGTHTSFEGMDAEALYEDTLSLMKTGRTDLETGVSLLRKSAIGGCSRAWLYLGQIYSNKSYAFYNPALAFDCYSSAAETGCADGYYNKGLCLSRGFGCQKDDTDAMQCFARGAEVFDPNCICALAMCYEFGIGCEINYEYAFNLYEKGAELGHASCANNLGGCYFYGHGVDQDKDYAIQMFNRAAELGSANASCRLGMCYMSGDGCEQNDELAFDYFKSASAEQNPIALFNLAKCYYNGIGTEQNFRLAFKQYIRAAKLGHAEAQYQAGKMYMLGLGTKKDPDAAYRMFSSAAKQNLTCAEYEVANCFFEGVGAVRNRANAYNHYLSAYEADGDHKADAAYRLGLCLLKGLGVKQQRHEAIRWFESGAELGSPEAMYMLGECYNYGIGTTADQEKAFALYLCAAKAAEQLAVPTKCHAHLFIAIAQCYEKGIGTAQDLSLAIDTYKHAAEHGDVEALYRAGCAIICQSQERSALASARTYFLRAARHAYMPAMLMMGIFSENGSGVQKNASDAKSWYAKAVVSKNDPQISLYEFPERFAENVTLHSEAKSQAQYRLGMLMARDCTSAQDQIRAFEYISISAAMGYAPARKEITKIHLSGGDLKTYYESPFSDENATFDGGHSSPNAKDLAIAMYKLGDAFFDGKGLLKKNEIASANCYKFSAELGMVDACYSYGWCLRHGVGTVENDAEAVKWLKLAADRGNAGAAYSYGLCCEEGAGTGVKNKREAMYYYRMAATSGHADAAKRYISLSDRGE
ncbi:MAG: sel1 repeat family protein [Ruminococcaceae bacterium]|nr:sel1 repeat family protein [Oscillospiraceae bacterium]